MTTEDYISINRQISERGARLFEIPSVRAAVVASSGAAHATSSDAYGILKRVDEAEFSDLGSAHSVPTTIARIWSVSGAFCTKPSEFALYDLIRQARESDALRITAAGRVLRRYVDAGEFMCICLGAALSGSSGVIDSSGQLIELGELATAIQAELGTNLPVERPDIVLEDNAYFSDSDTMNRWSNELRIPVSQLGAQIRTSSMAVRSTTKR